MKKMLGILGLFLSLGAFAGDLSWETDFEAAKTRAAKEKKTILMNFTGSDWCGWCKRLDREVFSQPAFQQFASSNLILVKIDFPKYAKQSEEEKSRNWKLAERYGVSGFPAILLVDSSGAEKLRTGYIGGGPDQYVNHLKGSM